MRNPMGATKHQKDRRTRHLQLVDPGAPPVRPVQLVTEPLTDAPPSGDRLCRILNLTVAVIGLLIAAPLMLLISIAIKLTSPGPIFFTQQRVGLDSRRHRPWETNHRRQIDQGGRIFRIYKFRTMHTNGSGEQQVWAEPNDPRITAVGRVLRRYRLDELPQLINVIRGEMNVVGPRPEQPAIFLELRDRIEGYAHRQRVLPGITGWAQINQAYDRSIEDVERKLKYDLEYLARRSWREDLRIMFLTIPVIIFRRGGW